MQRMKVDYYADNRNYEPIDVINDWGLNFNLGNAVKYIARAGRKTVNPVPDLEKAVDYIQYDIDRRKRGLPDGNNN